MSGATWHEWEILRRLRRCECIFERLREHSGQELHIQKQLRRDFPDEVVRAALTLHELRARAIAKFSRASEMWFDRQGLEQATSEAVARHKAQRFDGRVWDACCGVGGDTLALAHHCEVIAVDVNPANCLRTRWNAEVYGIDSHVQPICGDVQTVMSPRGLLHIDPDRRSGRPGRRVRIEEAVPGPEFLQQIIRDFPGGAIKLSPAANFVGKFPAAEIELVSLYGEAREATIWFGRLATPGTWRATILPAGETLAGDPLDAVADVGSLGPYLYDPDPAVVRAGLVDLLAEQAGLRRLDAAEEYLTSDTVVASPFVRAFEVLAELPNNDREIRRYFRAADFGQVEIKCRHLPVRPEAVRRKLPLAGDRAGVLIFARVGGKARAIVCRRID